MSKKIIRLTESEFKQYIKRIISEQVQQAQQPEAGFNPNFPLNLSKTWDDKEPIDAWGKSKDDAGFAAILKQKGYSDDDIKFWMGQMKKQFGIAKGGGGYNHDINVTVAGKQQEYERKSKLSELSNDANNQFIQLYKTLLKKDKDFRAQPESNSQYSEIYVCRKNYGSGDMYDPFLVYYGYTAGKVPNNPKPMFKLGVTFNRGQNNKVARVYNYPFNINQILSDLQNLPNILKKEDPTGANNLLGSITDVKGLSSGQYGDYKYGQKNVGGDKGERGMWFPNY